MTNQGRTEPSRDAGGQSDRGGPGGAKRKIDEIFGDVLPDTTSDERDPESTGTGRDDWYHENRPPHHER